MRELFFGGTFNPIHNGHLIMARNVAENVGFDRVTLVPSALPPHKTDVAPFADRVNMCQLATWNDDLFRVSDMEGQREGPSYTYDTAAELKAGPADPKVWWLIGEDVIRNLPKWHRWEELKDVLTFVVMARPHGYGYDPLTDSNMNPVLQRILYLQYRTGQVIDIRSTMIRNRVKADQSIRYLVPDAVEQYVNMERLYR